MLLIEAADNHSEKSRQPACAINTGRSPGVDITASTLASLFVHNTGDAGNKEGGKQPAKQNLKP